MLAVHIHYYGQKDFPMHFSFFRMSLGISIKTIYKQSFLFAFRSSVGKMLFLLTLLIVYKCLEKLKLSLDR